MYPLGCSLCRKVETLGSKIKEVNFTKDVIKPTAAASAFYNAHNPLLEKIPENIKPLKNIDDPRKETRKETREETREETQADKAKRERMAHAEEMRQQAIRNKLKAKHVQKKQLEDRLRSEAEIRARGPTAKPAKK